MRIYDPDEATLQALKGSNIELILGVPNDKIQSLTDSKTATNWVNTNVKPYSPSVKFSISLEYALFTQKGKNDAGYQNLFDAILDSVYAALEKVNAPNLKIVVSESGWPSQGGVGASDQNAGTYYKNLINHVKGGTIKRPKGPIETYLFAMFDEDLKKGAETEKHFGLFRPDKSPKYQITFN
ncbi:Glucan endo-1,3-beta-glucosidase, acidic isoform [Arachis hypogaea]|nr:Glucan endo-1,3-beta-glucosidase, acidic isoform [Arachis hypogaea]